MPLVINFLKASFRSSSCVLTIIFTVFVNSLHTQSPADMPLRQVISEAQAMIGQGDFAGASPLLDELEVRFEDE